MHFQEENWINYKIFHADLLGELGTLAHLDHCVIIPAPTISTHITLVIFHPRIVGGTYWYLICSKTFLVGVLLFPSHRVFLFYPVTAHNNIWFSTMLISREVFICYLFFYPALWVPDLLSINSKRQLHDILEATSFILLEFYHWRLYYPFLFVYLILFYW